jgi:hypothetical protein
MQQTMSGHDLVHARTSTDVTYRLAVGFGRGWEMTMALGKSALLGVVLLVGAGLTANAQYYYPAQYYSPPAPGYQAAPPPSWSYDPYTSGQAPCTQGIHGDLQTCAQKMPPTYGQPSYWSQR